MTREKYFIRKSVVVSPKSGSFTTVVLCALGALLTICIWALLSTM